MDRQSIELFREQVWAYYAEQGRHDMPWRQPEADGTFDAYKIMVSEIMLQQTQVARVIPKFEAFLATFPDVQSLAAAPLEAVLRLWNGLGYNRRAKFLWQATQKVVADYDGVMPNDQVQLVALPGIGVNTAGAIRAYSFNERVVFLETNVRTVFIHHFFADQAEVADKELLPIVEQALDAATPREWYWALMDYGSYLKQTVGNKTRASKAYAKQSTFQGSRRQVRGKVLRALTVEPQDMISLQQQVADDRLTDVLADLLQEGMICLENQTYRLGGS